MFEKAKLRSSVRATSKGNKRASRKVMRRVETRSATAVITTNLIKAFVLLFFGAIILFPFYYMISASLMSYGEVSHTGTNMVGNNNPVLLPETPQWSNYGEAFKSGYWEAFLFSTSIMIFQILLKIVVCILMGYAFGKYEFRFKKILWALLMLTLMVPEVAIMSGQYWVSKHIIGTTNVAGLAIALVGPFTASIFTVYLFRNGFEAIDDSVKEAALIDGVSGFRFFVKIAIPMVAPIIWTQIILTALASWNSYMWPSIMLGSTTTLKTIPLWLFSIGLQDDGFSHTEIKLAGSFLAIIPTVIFYLIFRKRINMTVAGSANKG